VLLLPWHLLDELTGGLNTTLPAGTVEVHARPGSTGEPWTDLIDLYQPLRDAIAAGDAVPVVLSGDCVASLAVIAGIQQRSVEPSLVWFDAHGDFHTEDTTTSGYLGGLPLAKAVGRGDPTLPAGLGLTPLSEPSVLLVDGRDLDPAEAEALASSAVGRASVAGLDASSLPGGPVIVHVDLDVIDPAQLSGLRFPAPGGPALPDVAAAVRTIAQARQVVALDVAATWRPDDTDRTQTDAALAAVLAAAGAET
jgi:arginase